MTELNERQKKLYAYLLAHNTCVSREKIGMDLSIDYPRAYEKSNELNSGAWRLLRSDIAKINNSNSQCKIISVKEHGKLKGYKIANEYEELRMKLRSIDRQLSRLGKEKASLLRALRNDKQYRIASETSIKEINVVKE